MISFAIIFTAQKASLSKKLKYPKVNCGLIGKEYIDRHEAFKKDAILEYKINVEKEEAGKETFFSGALQCFCTSEEEDGVSKNELYDLLDADGSSTYSEPICK